MNATILVIAILVLAVIALVIISINYFNKYNNLKRRVKEKEARERAYNQRHLDNYLKNMCDNFVQPTKKKK